METKSANWHQLDTKTVLANLETTLAGLTDQQAEERRNKYGSNQLVEKKQRSKISIFIRQFKDVMILILVLAAAISFIVGERTDAFVILAIILGNAILGYVQEYKAEESIKKLKQMAAQIAMVYRNKQAKRIPASDLVPGDIIILEAGDIVPADVRLLEINSLKIEEAALTGESMPVEKQTKILNDPDLLPADRINMAFKSTYIVNGSATAIVTGTGMKTEVGKIAQLLEGESEPTPLQKKLAKFSKQLALIVLIICAIIFSLGLYRGEDVLQMFLTALSLAVAALPEALPAVITISLANGAARMVRQNVLIRRLPAVETLGSITYICSDKTGTLTQNKMTVECIKSTKDKEKLLLQAMALNNEVKIDDHGAYMGDPTEVALIKYATEKETPPDASNKQLPLEGVIPFDSERMLMTTLHRADDKWLLLVKGAPTKIVDKLYDREKANEWLEENRRWAGKGLRVLFFAYKILDEKPQKLTADLLEADLEMLGLVGMIDPPRAEAIEAVKECHAAGIKTVMITGDQPLTAKSIAARLNIIEEGNENILTGADMLKMEPNALCEQVMQTAVYARVSPEQKLHIVDALQGSGEVVAMTGDGANDAPSLKKADIGIAMGITGTEVSKEAAHMILLDDNFASIVRAVKEGRRIYSNIRKFIQYVLACNLGEILVLLLYPFLGLSLPLLPIHILWINLVTDGLPGLALAREPAVKSIMKYPPRHPDEPIFTSYLAAKIIVSGLVLASAALLAQFWAINNGYSIAEQQTMVFTTLCFTQMGNALVVRGENGLLGNKLLLGAIGLTLLLQLLLIYIPALNPIFKTAHLIPKELIAVAIMSVACTIVLASFNYMLSLAFRAKR